MRISRLSVAAHIAANVPVAQIAAGLSAVGLRLRHDSHRGFVIELCPEYLASGRTAHGEVPPLLAFKPGGSTH